MKCFNPWHCPIDPLNYSHFLFFCFNWVFSTTLPFKLLIWTSALSNLLLFPSSVLFISVTVFFTSDWFFFVLCLFFMHASLSPQFFCLSVFVLVRYLMFSSLCRIALCSRCLWESVWQCPWSPGLGALRVFFLWVACAFCWALIVVGTLMDGVDH